MNKFGNQLLPYWGLTFFLPTLFSTSEHRGRSNSGGGDRQLAHSAVVRHDRSASPSSALGKKRPHDTAGRCALRHVAQWVAAAERRAGGRQRHLSLYCRKQRRNCLTWYTAACARYSQLYRQQFYFLFFSFLYMQCFLVFSVHVSFSRAFIISLYSTFSVRKINKFSFYFNRFFSVYAVVLL